MQKSCNIEQSKKNCWIFGGISYVTAFLWVCIFLMIPKIQLTTFLNCCLYFYLSEFFFKLPNLSKKFCLCDKAVFWGPVFWG